MKKTLLLTFFLYTTLFSEILKNEYPTKKLLTDKIPIVDIRTPPEWVETGLIKGAIPIMFFDQRGRYNIRAFLHQLKKKVDTTKPFAIICLTGSRTKILGSFLAQELNYKVTNLLGGMVFAKGARLPIEPYRR